MLQFDENFEFFIWQDATRNARTVLPLLSRCRSFFFRQHRSSARRQCRGGLRFLVAMAFLQNQKWRLYYTEDMQGSIQHTFCCLTALACACCWRRKKINCRCVLAVWSHRRKPWITYTRGYFVFSLAIDGSRSRFLLFPVPCRYRLRAGKNFAQISSLDQWPANAHFRVRSKPFLSFLKALSYFLTENWPQHWI